MEKPESIEKIEQEERRGARAQEFSDMKKKSSEKKRAREAAENSSIPDQSKKVPELEGNLSTGLMGRGEAEEEAGEIYREALGETKGDHKKISAESLSAISAEKTLRKVKGKVVEREKETEKKKKTKKEFEEKTIDWGLKSRIKRISDELWSIEGNRDLSWLEKRKAKEEIIEGAIDNLDPEDKKEKALIEKLRSNWRGKRKFADQIKDKEYIIKKEKPEALKADFSLESVARKLHQRGAKELTTQVERGLKREASRKNLSPEEALKAKRGILLRHSEAIETKGAKERILSAKDKEKEDLEARREARKKEFTPKKSAGRIAGTETVGGSSNKGTQSKVETAPMPQSLADNVKRAWGEDLFPQFELLKNETIRDVLKPKEKSAWEVFSRLFKKKSLGLDPQRKLATEKIRELFQTVEGSTEKFILSGMTVEQFLRRTLK